MRGRSLLTSALVAALAGCSEDVESVDAGPVDAGTALDSGPDAGPAPDSAVAIAPDAATPETLNGSGFITYVGLEDETAVPRDYSSTQVVLYTADQRLFLGSGTASGRFFVENVPPGLVTLVMEQDGYFVVISTRERTVDLGFATSGRPDLEYSSRDTYLRVQADGLRPWSPDDDFVLISASAGTISDGLLFGAVPPTSGSTDSGSLLLDCSYWCPVLDASRDDDPLLAQQLGRFTKDHYSETLGPALSIPVTSWRDGETSTVTGTFAVTGAERSVELDWNVLELEAALGPLPEGSEVYAAVTVAALPAHDVHGDYGQRLPLALLQPLEGTEQVTATLDYVHPFASSWQEYVVVSYVSPRAYRARGTTQPRSLLAYTFSQGSLEASRRISPSIALSVPLDLQIAGEDASDRLEGVGLTPHLRWSPPLIGTPGGYLLVLYEVEGVSGYTILFSRGLIATDEPEITLPSGILEPGKEYVLAVDAVEDGTQPVSARPYRAYARGAVARALTGIFAP